MQLDSLGLDRNYWPLLTSFRSLGFGQSNWDSLLLEKLNFHTKCQTRTCPADQGANWDISGSLCRAAGADMLLCPIAANPSEALLPSKSAGPVHRSTWCRSNWTRQNALKQSRTEEWWTPARWGCLSLMERDEQFFTWRDSTAQCKGLHSGAAECLVSHPCSHPGQLHSVGFHIFSLGERKGRVILIHLQKVLGKKAIDEKCRGKVKKY